MADPLGPSILSAAFLIIAAFVYALNAALPGVDGSELRKRADEDAHARRVLRLLSRFDNGFGEIRMTYVLLLAGSYASLLTAFSADLVTLTGLPALACALVLLALFGVLAFALTAIIPGGLAAHAPESTLNIAAAPAEWAVLLLSPITQAARLLGKAILHPFHIQPGAAPEHVSEEEILMMVDIGEEKGTIESDEKEMIENIFEFNNMNAEDCMIHRKDITAIDVDATDDEVFSTITESGLSRFPVYEDSIDNVIGILTSRDFLISRCSASPKPFRELIRPAHFVPESVHTDTLFREMQTLKQHMAIVIDEYGGTSGLITLEDLLEEIVGNIYDEFDPKEESEIEQLEDNLWRVNGTIALYTLAEALELELPEELEYDTLGGMVFSMFSSIPDDGSKPEVTINGLHVQVESIADHRIEKALVSKVIAETPEEDETDEVREENEV